LDEEVLIRKPRRGASPVDEREHWNAANAAFGAISREAALVVERRSFPALEQGKDNGLGLEALDEATGALWAIVVQREDVIPGGEHAGREIEPHLIAELGGDTSAVAPPDRRAVARG